MRRCAIVRTSGSAGLLVLMLVLASAGAVRAEPITLARWTVDGGGMGFGQLGTWIVAGTIGQPDAGRLRTGLTVLSGGFWVVGGAVPVDVPFEPPVPSVARDEIFAAQPNPFPGATRVSFALERTGLVDVSVFDVRGRRVRMLEHGSLGAGLHVRPWDARDDAGRPLGPGVYLLRIQIPSRTDVQRLVHLR